MCPGRLVPASIGHGPCSFGFPLTPVPMMNTQDRLPTPADATLKAWEAPRLTVIDTVDATRGADNPGNDEGVNSYTDIPS